MISPFSLAAAIALALLTSNTLETRAAISAPELSSITFLRSSGKLLYFSLFILITKVEL